MPFKEIISCIYKITSPSGKIYIGQSYNYKQRLVMYKNLQCEKQRKLYNSFKKYGVNNHAFDIIELCNEDKLNDRERFYINKFDSFDTNHGLNLSSGGKSKGRMSQETKNILSNDRMGIKHHNYGKKWTDAQKKRLSIAHIGIPRTKEWRMNLSLANKGKHISDEQKKKISKFWKGKIGTDCKNSKPITQYTITGEFVKEWSCSQEVFRQFGWNQRNISSVCRGERNQANGFIWRLNGDAFDKYNFVQRKNVEKPIIQYDKDGVLVKNWDSLAKAARGIGRNKYGIFNCLSKVAKSAYGYKWKYA